MDFPYRTENDRLSDLEYLRKCRLEQLDAKPFLTEDEQVEAGRLLEMYQRVNLRQSGADLALLMSCDLNNILTVILGDVQLLQMKLDPGSENYERVQRIARAGAQAGELFGFMIGLVLRERYDMKPVSLNDVVGGFEFNLADNIILNLDMADDLPAITADPRQVKKLLEILSLNSVEALGESGGEISVATQIVDLAAQSLDYSLPYRSNSHYLKLTVSDNGPGIPDEDRKKVFEPFFTTKQHHYGLGLTAAHAVTRGHLGGIRCLSNTEEPPVGTTIEAVFWTGE